MRSIFTSIMWGLAMAALLIATPVRAVALETPADRGAAVVGTTDAGGGWNEVVCAGCVAAATLTLFTGGIKMLPVLLANPEMIGTFTGMCVVACESAIKEMLK